MPSLNYVKPTAISLKGHPEFSEQWLQDRIAEDPGIIGLGELDLIVRERRQEKAGRLDLLLFDRDANCRYEVELMLGTTDESHIIRCIEYWDIERRRFPGYDHCAVLVAEDVTSRFLNILGLFAGTIPFIAIQLNALQVGDQIVLDFVRVLDRMGLRTDDEAEEKGTVADRKYWLERSSQAVLESADDIIQIVNQKSRRKYQLNYVRGYIGMHDGSRSRNFIYFSPKREFLYINLDTGKKEEWAKRLEADGLETGVGRTRLWATIRPADLQKHRPILTELLHEAVEEYDAD